MGWIIALHAVLLAWVIALKFRVIDGRISPDGQMYLNMAAGRKVPAPYCWRPLIPLLVRSLKSEPLWPFRIVAGLGSASSVICVYGLTFGLTSSAWAAFAAACAWIGAESAFGLWLFLPWLVDSWATVFAMLGAMAWQTPTASAWFLVLAFATKEAFGVLGWAFAVGLGAPWWIGVPGLVVYGLIRLAIKAEPSEIEWLKRPFWYSQTAKRRFWFHYERSFAALKLTPLLALYFLPGTPLAWPCLAVFLLAFASTMSAVDHARLIAAAFPFIICAVASLAPPPVLAIWAVASLFWPFKVEVTV